MLTPHQPQLLNDKSRLNEIYNLRVFSWENSPQSVYINSNYFPNGWFDKLDEHAFHWIIENEKSIIASSRIAVLSNLEMIEENYSGFSLPVERPFAHFSRLVVHPDYRGKGISKIMDIIGLKFIKEKNVAFTLASVESEIGRKEVLLSLGFQELGNFTHYYGQNIIPKKCTAFILHTHNI